MGKLGRLQHIKVEGQPRTFQHLRGSSVFKQESTNYMLAYLYGCTRNSRHQAIFHLKLDRSFVTKVGQYPSLADLSTRDIRKYAAVAKQQVRELSKAVGLFSHGVGVGSFVYLRRIFEQLVEQARAEAAKSSDWDNGTFERARMGEKITMLKSQLPPFMVDHAGIYSIMSIGVHTLSDEECMTAFPIIRTSVELMLDQKLAEHERKKKIENTSADVNKLHSLLAAKSSRDPR